MAWIDYTLVIDRPRGPSNVSSGSRQAEKENCAFRWSESLAKILELRWQVRTARALGSSLFLQSKPLHKLTISSGDENRTKSRKPVAVMSPTTEAND